MRDIIEKLSYFLSLLVSVIMGTIAITIIIQIVFRYLLNSPLIWTEELVNYAGTWMIMLATALLQKENGHIGLDLFPEKHTKFKIILSNIIVLIFSSFLIVPGIKFTLVSSDVLSGALRIPYWYSQISMPIGFALLLLYSFVNLAKIIFSDSPVEE